jgi:hypothetical protein
MMALARCCERAGDERHESDAAGSGQKAAGKCAAEIAFVSRRRDRSASASHEGE